VLLMLSFDLYYRFIEKCLSPINMSSYWSKRRKIKRGVEQDLLNLMSASIETERLHCNIGNFEQVAESNNRVESVDDHTLSSSEGRASERFAGNTEESNEESIDEEEDDINEESIDEEDDIRALLSDWEVRKQIPHSALTELLKILSTKLPELGLPKDSQTLLKTKSAVEMEEVSGGTYFHAGIEHGLLSQLTALVHPMRSESLSLQVNIDGLPLYKSSNSRFWPILGLVENNKDGVQTNKLPFVIGMFFEENKPASLDYLQDFVKEMQHLEKGFFFEGRNIQVQISAIVCDAPARAFIRNSKGHNGYYGCDKCSQKGVYYSNRMTFPETTACLRSNHDHVESFSEDSNYNGKTPLESLSIGLVTSFPLDYMHLVCLGVTRKTNISMAERATEDSFGPNVCQKCFCTTVRATASYSHQK